MRYKFPTIRTIEDVLPHIDGYNEFVIADKGDYTVINYAVAMPQTFHMENESDIGGAIRRECRGLIFNKSGLLISRPFHKFFNIGERDETQPHLVELDLLFDHIIMEKVDGSMIRPIPMNGELRFGTKMGITDIACDAEKWLLSQNNVAERMAEIDEYIRHGMTPIFEWISPKNQIVLSYEKEDLVLLALRDNFTGIYHQMPKVSTFTLAKVYGEIEGLAAFMEKVRSSTDQEGHVIRFLDGHMLKFKCDWYVRIHKTLERVTYDRNIVNLILNEEVDDVLPKLPQSVAERVKEFETRFWKQEKIMEERLLADYEIASNKTLYPTKKEVALQFMPMLEDKQERALVFKLLDGANVRELLLGYLKNQTTTNVKWEECAKWLGM